MQRRFKSASLVVVLAAFSLTLVGCAQVGVLKARKSFKDANLLYAQQDYKRAADMYEEAVSNDPTLSAAYFYLANSYDQQFKATKRGDPTNDNFLTLAINNYKLAAEKDQDPKIKKLALQYLVNAYGPDKLNDPGQAVPILEKMIQMEPDDTANYFALAKMYEDAGQYDEAEKYLNTARERKPKDPSVYGQLAGFFNRQGEFEKTIDAYKQWQAIEPNNPEVYYTIGSFYWDKVYHDTKLKPAEKKDFLNAGMQEIDKAIQLKPDYFEAVNRKGLLVRLQAGLTTDKAEYDRLMKEADDLLAKSVALQKKKAAGM
jgi:tetratricopeptide (TPR) repeat protein